MKHLVRQRADLAHPVGYRTTTPVQPDTGKPRPSPRPKSGPPVHIVELVPGNPLHESLVAKARRSVATAKETREAAARAKGRRAAAALQALAARPVAPKPKADLRVDLATKVRLERGGMGEAAIRRSVESAAAAKPVSPKKTIVLPAKPWQPIPPARVHGTPPPRQAAAPSNVGRPPVNVGYAPRGRR